MKAFSVFVELQDQNGYRHWYQNVHYYDQNFGAKSSREAAEITLNYFESEYPRVLRVVVFEGEGMEWPTERIEKPRYRLVMPK